METNLIGRSISKYESEIQQVIEFFTEMMDLQSAKAQENITNLNSINSRRIKNFDSIGFFSEEDILLCVFTHGCSAPTTIISYAIKKLEECGLLARLPEMFKAHVGYYKVQNDGWMFMYNNNLLINIIGGAKYIVSRYSKSTIKVIFHDKKGDEHIGTAFYYNEKNKDLLITNKHCLENAQRLNFILSDETSLEYKSIYLDKDADIGIVELKNKINEINPFILSECSELFEEIITIGYPSIPMTQDSYQICHKGEINSFVKDYHNNELFIFSAKTSAGNSGGPVIDQFGMVIGIITEELFDPQQLADKGKLPYYAAISGKTVLSALARFFNGKTY